MMTPRCAFGMGRLGAIQQGGVAFLSGLGNWVGHITSFHRLSFVVAEIRQSFVTWER